MRAYVAFALLFLFSSCLKETAIPIASSFELMIPEDKTSPVIVKLQNNSYGADEYEWTFEGGVPASSKEKVPEPVTFTEAGEHKIRLRVWNAVEERVSEQTIRVDSALSVDFDYEILVNDIAPAEVKLINNSKGGDRYLWVFEGANVPTTDRKYPEVLCFERGGEKRIKLSVFNGSKTIELSKQFTLREPTEAKFDFEPIAVDQDWEAPLSLVVRNRSLNALRYEWAVSGNATIKDKTAEQETTIRFTEPGKYRISLTAYNDKVPSVITKEVEVKANRGFLEHQDVKFGISQASDRIGCFYSACLARTLTSGEIKANNLGKHLDVGFFGLNSAFDYCLFFSPDEAQKRAFGLISGATHTVVHNLPCSISLEDYERIKLGQDFDRFTLYQGKSTDYFGADVTPRFVLFKTADGRRGIIKIKDFVRAGVESYILTDVKIEKRKDE